MFARVVKLCILYILVSQCWLLLKTIGHLGYITILLNGPVWMSESDNPGCAFFYLGMKPLCYFVIFSKILCYRSNVISGKS